MSDDEFTIGPKLPGSENHHVAIKHTAAGDKPGIIGVVGDGHDIRQYPEAYQIREKKDCDGRYCATKIWERPTSGPAQVATETYRANYDTIFN